MLASTGRLAEATLSYERAVINHPTHVDALHNYAGLCPGSLAVRDALFSLTDIYSGWLQQFSWIFPSTSMSTGNARDLPVHGADEIRN